MVASNTAALGLDIDGTLNTGDPTAIRQLLRHARSSGVDVHINTARPPIYCADPDQDTTAVAPRAKHHCLVHRDPPTSKVLNMRRIQQLSGVENPRCNILVDDRPENIEAVRRHGFSGVLVDERTGIDATAAEATMRILDECAATKGPIGRAKRRSHFRLALIVVILFLLCVLMCT